MTREELWRTALADLELNLSKANFTTWFKSTFISSWDDVSGEVIIGVPNAFTQAWLEKKYHKTILSILREVTDNQIKNISYKVEIRKKSLEKIFSDKEIKVGRYETKVQSADKETVNQFGLNSKYTFENFIVGDDNALAHAASQGVVKNLGKKYNPLFIYGGVGLGKTHLVQAIGNEIVRKALTKKVLYVSAEKFTNDYIESLRTKKMNSFKTRYRNVDVLLVDDIQFIVGKEQTQEEFFHTFDDLYHKDGQIVLTSDRLPQAIPTLEERLRSRFQMGVIADIAPPKLETRIAILEAKAKERSYDLNQEIIQYLAANIQTNVRELEGALNKIIAYHDFYNMALTIDTVKNILTSLTSRSNKGSLTIRQVIEIVADFYELKKQDIIASKCRRREIAIPRQIAMYLLRTELNTSYPTIGKEFGGRDHTTAIHAFKQIKNKVDAEDRIKNEVEMIKQRLYN